MGEPFLIDWPIFSPEFIDDPEARNEIPKLPWPFAWNVPMKNLLTDPSSSDPERNDHGGSSGRWGYNNSQSNFIVIFGQADKSCKIGLYGVRKAGG
jgi:hypothetical protein